MSHKRKLQLNIGPRELSTSKVNPHKSKCTVLCTTENTFWVSNPSCRILTTALEANEK